MHEPNMFFTIIGWLVMLALTALGIIVMLAGAWHNFMFRNYYAMLRFLVPILVFALLFIGVIINCPF